MCWTIHSSQSGGRGVNYQIISNNMPSILNDTMYLEEYGWIGAGKARICIENDGLFKLNSQKKTLDFSSTFFINFVFVIFTRNKCITCGPNIHLPHPRNKQPL